MKAKLDFRSKRTIIITAIIAALAVGAGVGAYFYAKGNNEASATTNTSDSSQTATDGATSGDNNQGNPASNDNNGNENGGTNTPTDGIGNNQENDGAANNGADANGNAGNGAAGIGGAGANAGDNGAGAGAGAAGNGGAQAGDNDGGDATTTTENIVVENPWEAHETFWRPQTLNVSTPDININENKIDVVKSSTTSTGNKSVSAGDTITYTITVTNNNTETLNSLYITDEIPEGTTFSSIENGGETVKEDEVVKKVYWNLWNLGIEAGKTYSVSFKVTVNKDAKGTIRNVALVEKNKTNETKDSVIKSNKIASLVEIVKDEDGKEAEKITDLKDKTVKEGQIIRYTITVENTSKDEKATTKVFDTVPEGTTLKGEEGEEVTVVNGEKTTTYSIAKLNEGIDLTIAEEGKATISFDVKVNKDTPKIIKNIATVGSETPTTENEVYTDIEINKTWDDADDQDGKRPDEITIVLNKTVGEETTKVDEATVTARKGWKFTFDNLPKYEGENIITYSIEEIKVKEYETKIDGFTIINKHNPEVTETVVNKIWDDNNDQDGVRPEKITVTLNKIVGNKTEKVKDITLDKNNNWTSKVDNLPKYSNGEEITYTWKEENLSGGYSLTKTETAEIKDEDDKVKGTSTTFTNSRKPELTEASVKKIWDDANDKDKKRPKKLIVELNNGTKVTLNKDNDWTATVKDLPKYSDGKEITYTWTETEPDGYTLTDTKKSGKLTTLTNTHEPEKIEKDKTATDLNENYESTVTLSIPGEEKVEDYDVVFVLDKSASANDEVTRVINEYVDTISSNNASIKTGIVSFYNKAVIVKELNKQKIDSSTLTVSGNGTNLPGGIQLGTKMLDDDTEVSSDHKYLIVISDGDTHVFNQDNKVNDTPTVVLDKSGNDYVAGPGAYERKYGNFNPPADWDEYFVEIAKLVKADGTSYQTPWAHSSNRYNSEVSNGTANGYIDEGKLSEHACTVDTSLYYAYENYKDAQNKGYNTYAVGIDSKRYYGPSFMDYLNGGKRLNLGDLVKTVYYVPAGSYVTDIMGEGKDDQGNDYNFDFVNDIETMDIILNGQTLPKVEKEDENGNGNKYYAFGNELEDKDGKKYYPFTVVYDEKTDSFVWHFNVNLTVYDNIKLVYKVKLTNPQEEPGEYTGLETNKEATITTPDGTFEFPKPEVEYKVVEKTNIKVMKIWEDNNSENRPDSITIQIKVDNEFYKEVVLNSENVTQTKIGENDAWEYVLKLPKYKTDEDGNETSELINYIVEETKIGDTAVRNNAALGYTITTTTEADPQSKDDKIIKINNKLETINITVNKEWVTKNATTEKPEKLTVKLMNGKKEVEKAVLDEDNSWKYEFKNKDKLFNGEKIDYTIEEESVKGFYQSDLDKKVDEDGNVTYKLTNSPSLKIKKESATDGNTVEVGENITYTVTVTNKNDIDEVTNLQESIPDNTKLVGNIEIASTGKDTQTTKTMPTEITVPAKGKTIITFTVEVQNSALGTGDTITNTAKIGENDKIISSDTIKNNAQKELKIYQVETENQGQTVVVVIDMSLSMASAINPAVNSDTMAYAYNETRWYYLTDALDKFIDEFLSNSNNKISIVGYNENATKLCDFTNNKNTAKNSYKDVFTQTHFNNLQKAAACGNEAFNAQKDGSFQTDLSSSSDGYNIDVDALTYLGEGKWNKTVTVVNGPDRITYRAGEIIPGAKTTDECLLGSGTNITKGLSIANSELDNNVMYTSVVLMTDGEANRDKGKEAENAAAIRAKGADLYTIGFTNDVHTLESTVGSSNITKSYTATTATQLSNAFGDIAGKITNLPVVTKTTTTGTVDISDIKIKNDSDVEIVAKVNGTETKLFDGKGSTFKSEYMTGNSFNYKKLLENKNVDPDAEVVMTINTNV